ncbi:CdaR family transcriptional regulator [Kutzneria buriramensis]|uniref:PucR-like helix-turn-helix protein n=1 Tax=Kutzneria buriramensis TaxID=1045776 RepID=A0A3E0G5C4_9PSEU|nr:helix-turn-helix domain-containing protein [Kutzneria buriramensis]REH17998.1 PucR-like helix-turn-helix protein [Kutzneria buriramensis]
MTVLEDRPGQQRQLTASADELTSLADRLSRNVLPADARHAARVLYREVARVYTRILDGTAVTAADQRGRLRAAGHALAAAGGSPDMAADHIGHLTSYLVDHVAATRPQVLPAVVSAGNLMLRDLFAGAGEQVGQTGASATQELVPRLVAGDEIPPDVERDLADGYDIFVVRPAEVLAHHRLLELFDEVEQLRMLGAIVDGDGILLVPSSRGYPPERVFAVIAGKLGSEPWCAMAHRTRDLIASGYDEAADILTLALSSGRRPGLFGLRDFLIEYAVLRQSSVTDSLVAIIKPLLANEILRETLLALIEFDFNRNMAAQALFIHRSTLDYRVRRIEEVTGYNPTSGRGAQVLSAAMTSSTAVKAIRRRPPSS